MLRILVEIYTDTNGHNQTGKITQYKPRKDAPDKTMTTPPDNCPTPLTDAVLYDPVQRGWDNSKSLGEMEKDQYGDWVEADFARGLERQLTAILNDKPTATEFEQVCTSNHQLERELAQLRHEGGIKDGRIAELEGALKLAVDNIQGIMDGNDIPSIVIIQVARQAINPNTNACLLKEESPKNESRK